MGWLAGWSYRKTVTITGQAGAGTDYQVNLSIGDASGGDDFHLENHCTSFPNDIQVTDNDQTTPLDYWVEDLTVDPIKMWVEVADDLSSNVDICVYYAKSGAASASDGDNTFLFFDDFSDASIDTSKWEYDTGDTSITGGILTLTGSTKKIHGKPNRAYPFIGETRAKVSANSHIGARIGTGDLETAGATKYVQQNGESFYTRSATSGDIQGRKDDAWVSPVPETTIEADLSVYETLKFVMTTTNIKIYYDNTLELEITTNIPTADQNFWFKSVTSDDVLVDWTFIRKQNTPEPAFSSAGGEETLPVGHPTMARWHGVPGMNYTGRRGGW